MSRRFVFVLLFMCVTVAVLSGCGAIGRGRAPSWISGPSRDYPAEQYLAGVGQADSKEAAAERAYGAVAKIFKAEVTAQSRDWESFLSMERRGHTDTERRLTLEQVTKVSTDKALENVRILDTWQNPRNGQHYALAGMNRTQAAAALEERIGELDAAVAIELMEGRQTTDKLAKVRNFWRALNNLVLREAHNTDLRVIRLNGQGNPPAYRVAELTAELEQFLAAHLVIGVEITGEQADLTRRAVMEGLIREGLPVTARLFQPHTGTDGGAAGKIPELLVKGAVDLWDVDVPDPRFRYVRWCSDFVIEEIATQRIVGALSVGGREGHLTAAEARAKAVRVMQQELTSHLAKTFAAYVFGETDLPADLPASACPQKKNTDSPVPEMKPLS